MADVGRAKEALTFIELVDQSISTWTYDIYEVFPLLNVEMHRLVSSFHDIR